MVYLESERAYEPELDMKMDLIDSGSPSGWEELSNWLLSTDRDEIELRFVFKFW